MNEELKKFLLAIVNVFGMDEASASKLIKDDGTPEAGALEKILELDKDRIKKLKDSATFEYDKGFKKAKAETMNAFESSLMSEFAITSSDKKGMDLIKEIVAAQVTKSGGNEITDDVVKRHPAYIKLQLQKDQEIVDKTKDLQQKLDDTVSATARQEKWNKVKAKILTEFKDLKPVEAENQTVAQTRFDIFLSELEKNYQWDMDGNGNVIIKKSDGELATDDHGHTIPLKKLVETTAAKHYEFKAADDRSSGGDSGKDKGKGPAVKLDLKTPATPQDYIASMKQIAAHPTLSEEEKSKAKDELTTKWQEVKQKMN